MSSSHHEHSHPPDLFTPSAAARFSLTDESSPPPPPPPPPKTGNHPASGQATPHLAPPLPPHPSSTGIQNGPQSHSNQEDRSQVPPSFDEAWLPEALCEKSKADLENALHSSALTAALLNAPSTVHPSLSTSNNLLHALLAENLSLAEHLLMVSSNLDHERTEMTAKLLSLRALERQWHLKQSLMDDALSSFAPKAVHTRLVAGINEQRNLLAALEDSFVEDDGIASEREVADFLRRWKDSRKILFLREERKRRFEEGRVGGWR